MQKIYKEFSKRKLHWVILTFSMSGLLLYQICSILFPNRSFQYDILIMVATAVLFATFFERRNDGKIYRIRYDEKGEEGLERSGKKLKMIFRFVTAGNIILFFLS